MKDRSSRPLRSPRQTRPPKVRKILHLRTKRGWGPARIAHKLGMQPSTVNRVLRHEGAAPLSEVDLATRKARRAGPAGPWTTTVIALALGESAPLKEASCAEAAYFAIEDGKRAGYVIFDMTESHDMPPILEPLFLDLDARVEMTPCMNREELSFGILEAAKHF